MRWMDISFPSVQSLAVLLCFGRHRLKERLAIFSFEGVCTSKLCKSNQGNLYSLLLVLAFPSLPGISEGHKSVKGRI